VGGGKRGKGEEKVHQQRVKGKKKKCLNALSPHKGTTSYAAEPFEGKGGEPESDMEKGPEKTMISSVRGGKGKG